MKASILLGLILVSMSLTGCDNGSSSSASPKEITAQEQLAGKQTQTLANGIKIEIQKVAPLDLDKSNYAVFKTNLNHIKAKILLPEDIAASVQIRKSVTVPGEFLVTPQFENVIAEKEYVDGYYEMNLSENLWLKNADDKTLDLRPRTLTIKIYSKDGLTGESSATFLPDLIVGATEDNSSITLKSLGIISGAYKFDVIFLEAKSTLETQGVKVSLQVDRFYVAEQATIMSFSEAEASQDPEKGQVGRDGGVLEISADKAEGQLSIFMRGTKGGKGLEAIEQKEIGATGSKGAPGTTEQKCGKPSKEATDAPCWIVCATNPGNGSIGGKGVKGITGGVGMRGGSSGYAIVRSSQKMNNFDVIVHGIPGEGGPGGDGGKGGPGGDGGAPGDKPKACKDEASTGPQGPAGDQGNQGQQGDSGTKEI